MSVFMALAALSALLMAAVVGYTLVFPLRSPDHPLPALSPEEAACASRQRRHVTAIASRPHNLGYFPALEAAACYIEQTLVALGLQPRLQEYVVEGRPVRNIEVLLPARAGTPLPIKTLVVGAHYDSPDDSPGANDNGTGVAALIEIARDLTTADAKFAGACDVRLVFFVNEELPYGKTDAMGSLRHARELKSEGVSVLGMIALETLGYFSSTPGSQKYPPPFGLVYPTTGNFVAFVGLPGARRLVGRALRAFRKTTPFPSIGGVAPGFIPGIDLSDHWAYDHCGYPALMVTDTAPFRNPYYHTRADLPDTVDYDSLARITGALTRTIRALAS